MTDDPIQRSGRVHRRKFLTGVGAGVTAGLAGCSEGDPEQTGTPTEEPDDTPTEGSETTEPEGTSPEQGGTPTVGLAVAPVTLNPLRASSVYDFYVIDRVMSPSSVATHPDDQSFQPWFFTDWEVNPDNVGSSEPTLTAELRDDLTFSDGEPLTAEDYQFTAEYFKEQNPSGSLTGAAHQVIEEVTVDSPDGTTVSVFMESPEQRWFTNILGFPILPKHIWENVADYTEYAPRNEEGLVGAGAWELVDFNWENWFELETRDDWAVASADSAEWLDDGAPFVDGIRFEIFGSQNAMEQAVLNGDIDAGFAAGGFTVSNAVQAQQSDALEVQESADSGYNHMSFNLRRVPFDDVAFRQFLVLINDGDWIVEEPYQGIAAMKGDYVVPPALGEWRLDDPTEIEAHEGIAVPNLEFPGEPGTFNLTGESIQTARDFLVNHPDAKHDYSFEEAQTDLTRSPDGLELYVNGQHFNEAHTDNDGNGSQGPLEFNFQPPQEDIYQARTGQQFVGLLGKIGIPTEPKVQTINAQLSTVYIQENFDIFSMGWSLGVNMTHFLGLYSSEAADLDGTNEDTQMFNPMGYTGADEYIFEDGELMDFDQRVPLVKQIQAKMWYDAPTAITEYNQLLEPTNTEYSGWINQFGGSITEDSFLNIRQG